MTDRPNPVRITVVRTEDEAAEVRALVDDFVGWLMLTYPDEAAALERYFAVQDLAGQMRNLLTVFGPPRAACLLARIDGAAVGTVMLKPRADHLCEMNRMFVRDTARGQGVGRALCIQLLATARRLGYRQMLLAAGPRHTAALQLYESLGFRRDASLADTGAGDIEIRMICDLESSPPA